MGIFDGFRNMLKDIIHAELSQAQRERITVIEKNRRYRRGQHPATMKQRIGKHDDNVTLNLIGLAVSRSVSLLFGKGVEFDMPDNEEGKASPAQEYIDKAWDLNRKEILLHKLAMNGAEAGTAYIKILPNWYEDEKGTRYPRFVVVLPETVTIHTDPDDMEVVTGYTVEYSTVDLSGKEVWRKQEIYRDFKTTEPDEEGNFEVTEAYWTVEDWEYSEATGNRWEMIDSTKWPYEFAPMIYTQNLPSSDMVYGEPDITADVRRLNDQINYIAANIGKIIRYHAHPKTLLFGIGKSGLEKVDDSVDQMWTINAPNADAKNLEMQSDLSSSQTYLQTMRNMLMDVTRTVDISSLPDKIGALTNFGLRVLYQDALQKMDTKRKLYGEMLIELNRRCLELASINGEGGECVWPEPLPENETEETQALQSDLSMGIVSKQTVARARGYDWDEEQERMADEEANEGDIGTRILNDYMKGV